MWSNSARLRTLHVLTFFSSSLPPHPPISLFSFSGASLLPRLYDPSPSTAFAPHCYAYTAIQPPPTSPPPPGPFLPSSQEGPGGGGGGVKKRPIRLPINIYIFFLFFFYIFRGLPTLGATKKNGGPAASRPPDPQKKGEHFFADKFSPH